MKLLWGVWILCASLLGDPGARAFGPADAAASEEGARPCSDSLNVPLNVYLEAHVRRYLETIRFGITFEDYPGLGTLVTFEQLHAMKAQAESKSSVEPLFKLLGQETTFLMRLQEALDEQLLLLRADRQEAAFLSAVLPEIDRFIHHSATEANEAQERMEEVRRQANAKSEFLLPSPYVASAYSYWNSEHGVLDVLAYKPHDTGIFFLSFDLATRHRALEEPVSIPGNKVRRVRYDPGRRWVFVLTNRGLYKVVPGQSEVVPVSETLLKRVLNLSSDYVEFEDFTVQDDGNVASIHHGSVLYRYDFRTRRLITEPDERAFGPLNAIEPLDARESRYVYFDSQKNRYMFVSSKLEDHAAALSYPKAHAHVLEYQSFVFENRNRWVVSPKQDGVYAIDGNEVVFHGWTADAPRLVHRLGQRKPVRLAASPDGRYLAWVDEFGTLELFDLEESRVVAESSRNFGVLHLSFSPDSSLLMLNHAESYGSGKVPVFDLNQWMMESRQSAAWKSGE